MCHICCYLKIKDVCVPTECLCYDPNKCLKEKWGKYSLLTGVIFIVSPVTNVPQGKLLQV